MPRWLRSTLVLAGLCLAAAARAEEPTVFAAASLTNVLEEVARAYRAATGRGVRLSFAASSALARQIEQGAPAAIFASADEQWMDYLQQRGLIVPDTRTSLLSNRLVLVVPADREVKIRIAPGVDLLPLLGPEGRLAVGDPAHVPAGRYAQQALQHVGAWDAVVRRLVRADNVRVALAYVERGEVPAGIVYETDAALSTRVRIAGVFPADSHPPISYPVAVIGRNDSAPARDFLRFMRSAAAADLFRRHGFSVR